MKKGSTSMWKIAKIRKGGGGKENTKGVKTVTKKG